MRLITEFNENNIEVIEESTKSGGKKFVIEGVFAQSECQNRNGRIYPKKVMENAVNKYYNEQVKTGRAVGELNHPAGPTINLDKVSHLITDLRFEGNDVIGRATILDTPQGKIVQNLLEGGVKLGVSTRGMGSLVKEGTSTYVGDDFMLNTVDIVQDPSAPTAFVNGIMEGVEWVKNNGVFEQRDIEEVETEIKKFTDAQIYEYQVRQLKNFLSNI